jgi:hypothetical protein
MVRLLAVSVVAALLLSLAAPVAAAPPADNPGKGAPEISKIVFVHYPQGKGWGPGGNSNKGGGNGVEKLWYKYSGIHWASMPVEYYVNTSSLPSGISVDAIQDAFTTWDNTSGPYAVSYQGPTSSLPDNLDGQNVVGWENITDYPHAIAVTYIWYNTLSKELVEVDTALNSNSAFKWWQISVSDEEANNATWPEDDTSSAYDVDVQNIMTHEAGHWLTLDDLYKKPASTQTMYGISPEFELQKRSLESGDEAGIQAIYPNP